MILLLFHSMCVLEEQYFVLAWLRKQEAKQAKQAGRKKEEEEGRSSMSFECEFSFFSSEFYWLMSFCFSEFYWLITTMSCVGSNAVARARAVAVRCHGRGRGLNGHRFHRSCG